jgi:hypothetical protein
MDASQTEIGQVNISVHIIVPPATRYVSEVNLTPETV